jgi:polyhydroxybutyrate depolymerase
METRRAALLALAIGTALILVTAVFLLGTRQPSSPGPASARTVRVDGRDRTFLVFAPPTRPAGMVALLVYPGSGETAGDLRRRIAPALERMARQQGLVVAYLQGFESHFNDCRRLAPYSARAERIDDVAFSRAVVADLESRDGVDRRKVIALGYSNGGHMVFRLALEAPDLVAGVIAIAANVPAGDNLVCTPAPGRPPMVVLVEGDRDPINPYAGGRVTIFGFGDRGNVLSAAESAHWFASRSGSAQPGSRRVLGEQQGRVALEQDFGEPRPRVRLMTVVGGGHVIPQTAYRYPRILGGTYRDDAVLESAMRFVLKPTNGE